MESQNNVELKKYMSELAEDVKLDIYNLKEKSLMSSSIWAKWLSYLYKEKENADRIVQTKQRILKKKLEAQPAAAGSILKLKSEEKILESDDNLKKLQILAKMTQDNIDFIERTLTILSNFGFNVKNAIECFKLNMTH